MGRAASAAHRRHRSRGGGDGPVVVLMHGFGAPGDDLVALARVLDVPQPVRFVFPEGPVSLAPTGFGLGEPRAWWMIDTERLQRAVARGETRDLSQQVPDGLPEARSRVSGMLDALERELNIGSDRIVLGGFSQGAMLALDVALHRAAPQASGEAPATAQGAAWRPAALALLSSTLLAEQEWTPRMPALSGLPVLQSHGSEDPLLPYAIAERLRDLLVDAGAAHEWIPFQGSHEIPPPVLAQVQDFLHRTTRS